MRKIIAIIVAFLAALMLMPLFTLPVSAETNAPTWEKGESWAMGKEVDLESNLTDGITFIKQMATAQGFNIQDVTAEGKAAAWAVFSVDDVTSDTYILKTEVGAKVQASAHVKVTGPFPAAGEYDSSVDSLFDPSLSNATKTVEATLKVDYALVLSGTNILNKTDLAIRQLDYTAKTSAYISFVATNIPGFESTETKSYLNYTNYDVLLKADIQANVLVKFEPALNLYNFPLEVGDEWVVDSTANVSGSVNGFVSATGLQDSMKKQIFTEELRNATGASDFPIELGKLTTTDKKIENGTINAYEVPIYALMECTSKTFVTVPNVGPFERYEIKAEADGGPGLTFYYNTYEGFLSAMSPSSIPMLPSEVSSIMPEMTMESTDVKTATAAIDSIESYQATVSNKANGNGAGSDGMIFLIAIIVIIAAVIAVAFFVMRRKQ